jgi:hypothetical protein
MLKAGANEGNSGESAAAFNAARVDVLADSIGIIAADLMLGELTPRMASGEGLLRVGHGKC